MQRMPLTTLCHSGLANTTFNCNFSPGQDKIINFLTESINFLPNISQQKQTINKVIIFNPNKYPMLPPSTSFYLEIIGCSLNALLF